MLAVAIVSGGGLAAAQIFHQIKTASGEISRKFSGIKARQERFTDGCDALFQFAERCGIRPKNSLDRKSVV